MTDEAGDSDGSGALTRRHAVVGGAGAVVGGVAGVAIFSDGLFGDSGGTKTIEKREPNDDGEASLGELRWLLEKDPRTEYTIDVTTFTYSGDVIDVRYESAATEQSGSDRWRWHLNEMGHVISSFGQYVAGDGPNLAWPPDGTTDGAGGGGSGTTTAKPTTVPATTATGGQPIEGKRLIAHVENPYTANTESSTPPQDEVYGIERRWIRNWIAGAWSEQRLINVVRQSKVTGGN